MALGKKATAESAENKVSVRGKTEGDQKGKRKIKLPRFIRAIGAYFAGAWREIRQVRWPNRKATWSLTLAVLLFTLFWAIVILALDLLNQFIFNNVILK
ncbi:preprotein translocase subunit SecE [Candidatus Saccharibacteria bacterium]|nr:MAG: preprotein translocase subunit SecE [Candidatus Saccharibacteria bacterium]